VVAEARSPPPPDPPHHLHRRHCHGRRLAGPPRPFMRNALAYVAKGQNTVVTAALRQVFRQADRTAAARTCGASLTRSARAGPRWASAGLQALSV